MKDVLFGTRSVAPCAYCGRELSRRFATVDHDKPLSAGGSHNKTNCVLACRSCNERKGAMTGAAFRDVLRDA